MLDEMAEQLNRATESQLFTYKEAFLNSLRNANLLFGEYAFRRVSQLNRKRNPINKSLFTCMSVILAHYDHDDLSEYDWGDKALVALAKKLDTDIEFSDSFSKGTGDPVRISIQFGTTRKLIDEVIARDK